jgi:hypothetical protein
MGAWIGADACGSSRADPADRNESERQGKDAEGWQDCEESGTAKTMGNCELVHHEGGNDGDGSVGKGLEAGGIGDWARHGHVAVVRTTHRGEGQTHQPANFKWPREKYTRASRTP